MSDMVKIPVLDLAPQHEPLKKELDAAIDNVIRTNGFIMGPDVKKFEEEVAAYLGVKHALGVNSGTDALVIALRAFGIQAGDEVITTPFTFFATAESISLVGAKPVFADIDLDTFNIDPLEIEKKITSKTKAIMPVHLFGNPAAMEKILQLAEKHDLKVIEDCAQSFGARYNGKHTGALGHVGAFSFFPSKNLGAFGDGGLITTNDDKVADMSRMLRAHGSKKKYHNEILGYNSRLDTLQAAILRVKLPHIEKWNQGRRRGAQIYNKFLEGAENIVVPKVTEGHVFHQYTIRISNQKRDQVHARLEEQGISTMIYYPIPQDLLPIYKGQYPKYPISESLSHEVLSLPIWPDISESVIKKVADALRKAVFRS